MPVKIRKLKADLRKAGFFERFAKGSHTRWYYQHDLSIIVTMSGQDGDDAKDYQIMKVRNALKKTEQRGEAR